MKSTTSTGRPAGIAGQWRRRGRPLLLLALVASIALHLLFSVPFLVPIDLFAPKPPPPPPIPVEVVVLPAPVEPPREPEQKAEQEQPKQPEPPPQKVELPPAQPPPPVSPQQIVIATRDVSTPPQGDDRETAAQQKPEPQEEVKPPPGDPQTQDRTEPPKPEPPQDTVEQVPPEKPAPPKPEPPKRQAAPAQPVKPRPEPEPETEVSGAVALARPAARPRGQVTDAEHRMPPVVVRPKPPGRAGNSLMPSYPSAARANGLQGRVVLLAVIAPDGRPRRIDIARSSGYDQLDESAVRAVWMWRFYRTDNGPPMEATIEIPLDFKL